MTRDWLIAFFVLDMLLGLAGGLAVYYRTRLRRAEARIDQLSDHLSASERLLALTDPHRTAEISALKAQLNLPAHQRTETGR